jgi:hypothetical protein
VKASLLLVNPNLINWLIYTYVYVVYVELYIYIHIDPYTSRLAAVNGAPIYFVLYLTYIYAIGEAAFSCTLVHPAHRHIVRMPSIAASVNSALSCDDCKAQDCTRRMHLLSLLPQGFANNQATSSTQRAMASVQKPKSLRFE